MPRRDPQGAGQLTGRDGSGQSADPFVHLPHLRGQLTPAEQSALRVTPEVLATIDQRARDAGRPANWRLADDAREATRHAVLGDRDKSEDLWVFAYGSLMWDPGFHYSEIRIAEVRGYQRRFTLRSVGGRGTPENPCLFLSLEPRAGRCAGLAFRIPAHLAEEESVILWRREMIAGSYAPQVCPIRTPQGDVRAVLFAANPAYHDYCAERPLAETAAIIRAASGFFGSNRDYLAQVAAKLQTLQLHDDYIAQLWHEVQRAELASPS